MTQQIERRFAEGVTADKRTLSGTVIRYGEETTHAGRRERFERGAFGALGDVILNAHHERAMPIARTGAGLKLRSGADALYMKARLPKGRDATNTLRLVRAGVLRGLSIEFRALRERNEAGVRVIERAKLMGIAVVDTPAYPGSTVEARSTEAGNGDAQWWSL